MKRKTYRNFMRVMNALQKDKHYSASEAEKLTHIIFDNVEHDKGYGNRTAEYFLGMVICKEDFIQQCAGK